MWHGKLAITTPVILYGFVNWVSPWRAVTGQPVYLFGEDDFGSPYCPIEFEVRNDRI